MTLSRTAPRSTNLPTVTPAAATPTAVTSGRPLLGLIHPEGPAVQHGAVQLPGGGNCDLGIAHGDEGEAARSAGLAVGRNGDLDDFTDRREQVSLPPRVCC